MTAGSETLGAREVVAMMWYWGGGVHWWGWLLGFLGMIAFWALVIWAIWYFVTLVVRRAGPGVGHGDPKRILDERLARGEIDAEEYRRLRELMAGASNHAPKSEELNRSRVGTGGDG